MKGGKKKTTGTIYFTFGPIFSCLRFCQAASVGFSGLFKFLKYPSFRRLTYHVYRVGENLLFYFFSFKLIFSAPNFFLTWLSTSLRTLTDNVDHENDCHWRYVCSHALNIRPDVSAFRYICVCLVHVSLPCVWIHFREGPRGYLTLLKLVRNRGANAVSRDGTNGNAVNFGKLVEQRVRSIFVWMFFTMIISYGTKNWIYWVIARFTAKLCLAVSKNYICIYRNGGNADQAAYWPQLFFVWTRLEL